MRVLNALVLQMGVLSSTIYDQLDNVDCHQCHYCNQISYDNESYTRGWLALETITLGKNRDSEHRHRLQELEPGNVYQCC